jgi:kynurenine formamidase
LPPVCHFLALPLKIQGGSGSPIRAVALVPR